MDSCDDLAAVILEQTGSTWGQIPVAPDFLRALRDLTAQRQIVLIFDEVISGFRCSPGGAQQALGITPDLATLGKIVAGGMHGGAVVGRAAIMELLDFRAAALKGFEKIGHQGTCNAMPTTCAAAVATLEVIRTSDACQRAIRYGRMLQDDLNEAFRRESVPWIAYGTFGGFHVFTNPRQVDLTREQIESGHLEYSTIRPPVPTTRAMKLRIGCLLHGVDIQPWPGAPVSAAHTDDDRRRTVDAFTKTIQMMKDEREM
jgi:glutamate-1-semialdehyde 2,1-aminomutase